MRIVIIGKNAFVSIGGYLVCIGSAEEVDASDATRISEMVASALITSRYHSLQSKGETLH